MRERERERERESLKSVMFLKIIIFKTIQKVIMILMKFLKEIF